MDAVILRSKPDGLPLPKHYLRPDRGAARDIAALSWTSQVFRRFSVSYCPVPPAWPARFARRLFRAPVGAAAATGLAWRRRSAVPWVSVDALAELVWRMDSGPQVRSRFGSRLRQGRAVAVARLRLCLRLLLRRHALLIEPALSSTITRLGLRRLRLCLRLRRHALLIDPALPCRGYLVVAAESAAVAVLGVAAAEVAAARPADRSRAVLHDYPVGVAKAEAATVDMRHPVADSSSSIRQRALPVPGISAALAPEFCWLPRSD